MLSMPELPEVQTVVNYLNREIKGKKILDVQVLAVKMIKNVSVETFKETLINTTIEKIERLGKYLIFFLSNEHVMVSHLRMEGKYWIKNLNDPIVDQHIHLIFRLEDVNLCYHDTRKFGTFTIYKTKDFRNSDELIKIAMDPLSDQFNADYLYEKIHKSKKVIKTMLLEQALVSGIGNIYACEILFSARISPWKIAGELTLNECQAIVKEAKRILKLAVKNNGTTVSSFTFDNTHAGSFQSYLNVYGRARKKCTNCDALIVKDYINKRGTYYCPNCQR
ncbi:MAG: DNA-formamidopyrimidine glycosylase [Metamycoplasmataceae bacterium]